MIEIHESLGESVRSFGHISHAATVQIATAEPVVKAIIAERCSIAAISVEIAGIGHRRLGRGLQ